MVSFSSESDCIEIMFDRACRAAEAASELMMARYGGPLELGDKGLGSHASDVVTEVDLACQARVLEILFPRGEADPMRERIAVLAEEMSDHSSRLRFERPWTMLIDPLDGTRGYVDRTGSFGVSIAMIARDGSPVFGVAALPAHGSCLTGGPGRSTRCNGRPLAAARELAGAKVVSWVSEAEVFPAPNNAVFHAVHAALLERLGVDSVRPQCVGSPVHKGCLVALGERPGIYLGLPRAKAGVSLWDLAAVVPIVQAAGGWASDVHGQPLELNRAGSTYLHHRGFVLATAPALAEVAIEAYAASGFAPEEPTDPPAATPA